MVISAVSRNVFEATQVARHHCIFGLLVLVFVLVLIFRKESCSQIGDYRAGHEINGRDGVLGHTRHALHVPDIQIGINNNA